MVLFSDGYDNKGCDHANPAKPTATGQWFMEVSTARDTHTRYTAAGFVRSPLRLQLTPLSKILVPGQTLGIAAQVFDGKSQLTGLKASARVIAPLMGVPTLMKKFKAQLAKLRPPKLPKGDSMPKDIGQLVALRAQLLKDKQQDIFATAATSLRMVNAAGSTMIRAGAPLAVATPGSLLGRFADTAESGSYNVMVAVSGASARCGSRFVRQEMASMLAR